MLEGTEGERCLWRGPELVAEGVRDVVVPGAYGKEDWPGLLVVGEEVEMSARTQVCAQNAFPGKGVLRQIPVPQVD